MSDPVVEEPEQVEWFAGLTVDHLFADCPNRMRGEKTLREFGWWGIHNVGGLDPDGDLVCGMCLARRRRSKKELNNA